MKRRDILLSVAATPLLLPLGCASPTADAVRGPESTQESRAEAQTPPARVYGVTFLKSTAPDPDALAQYIRANWLVMDERAVEQGLLSDYRMLVSTGQDEPWNVMVIVGYLDPRGYEAIAKEFNAIRRDHREVLIDGKGMKELGSIVASRNLIPG